MMRRTLTKLHLLASEANLEIIRAFNLTPIVQTRNLFDVVVSMRDHLIKNMGKPHRPALHDRLSRMTEQEQYDYVIDCLIPWSVQFYVSWKEAQQRHPWLRVHWVDYDQLNADKVATITAALGFFGVNAQPQAVERVIASLTDKETLKNKAESGRGQRLLNDQQKDRLLRFAHYYDWIDFSPLGLSLHR